MAVWLGLATCSGLALGLAGRAAMRLVALQADVSPEFSWGGSAEVVLFGTLVGTPVALIFWALRARFRLPVWAGVWVGLAVFSVMATFPSPAARSALSGIPDAPVATAVVFAGAFVAYGLVLEALWRARLLHRRP